MYSQEDGQESSYYVTGEYGNIIENYRQPHSRLVHREILTEPIRTGKPKGKFRDFDKY